MSTHNFGNINGKYLIDFRVGRDIVMPAKYRKFNTPAGRAMVHECNMWISARESFRRWKIARKAWQTRKARQQPELPSFS